MAIIIALAMLALIAYFHNACLAGIARLTPARQVKRRKLVLYVFCLLALAHLTEISLFAALYFGVENWLWPQSFGPSFDGTLYDYLYASGMIYTTLGYTDINMAGPARMIAMGEALVGFMVLTWSSTYLYRACGTYWDDEEEA